jgi:hypothetical protein
MAKTLKPPAEEAEGACACGAVRIAIGVPARWAFHDHSEASRRAQGCAYVTYVGSYRSRFRFLEGEAVVTRHEHEGTTRSFCSRCGTPLSMERKRSPTMINLPRALFAGRTGREARYHTSLDEAPDWEYGGGKLVPLKGYPGVMWERPKPRKKRPLIDDFL